MKTNQTTTTTVARVLGAAALSAGMALAMIGGTTTTADARDRAPVKTVKISYQVAETAVDLDRFVAPPSRPAPIDDFATHPVEPIKAKKFCDGDAVADDIVACDIGEIAWSCPDGANLETYEGCDGNTDGLFD